MSKPRISVLLPNYNHGHFLRQSLAGFLRQSFEDFEILLIDDGSTDGSRKIVEEFAAKDERVKANCFPANRGIKAAFKDLCDRATGDLVYSSASDDFVIDKDFFKKAVTALDADPRPAGFYGVTGIYLAEKEKLLDSCGTAEVVGYNTPQQCCTGFLKTRSVVTSPSCIWRRDLFNQHGAADVDELIAHLGPQWDLCLCHILAFKYGMVYEKTAFACQRIYEARTNYSANLHLWKTAGYYAEMEKRLRPFCTEYPGIEADWMRWRAFWMMDVIRKSGVAA